MQICLDPYSIGRYSVRGSITALKKRLNVLILILLEDTL